VSHASRLAFDCPICRETNRQSRLLFGLT